MADPKGLPGTPKSVDVKAKNAKMKAMQRRSAKSMGAGVKYETDVDKTTSDPSPSSY